LNIIMESGLELKSLNTLFSLKLPNIKWIERI
jgi:hypothetical protein